MSQIDWSQSDAAIRKQLLRLSKTKLSRECKKRKMSNIGSKQNIIESLLEINKKKKKKNKALKHNHARKLSAKFPKDLSKTSKSVIKELNLITHKVLNKPTLITALFEKRKSLIKQIESLAYNTEKKQKIRYSAILCLETIISVDRIMNKKSKHGKLKKFKRYKSIHRFNIAHIIKHGLDLNNWRNTLKTGHRLDVFDTHRRQWKICTVTQRKQNNKSLFINDIKVDLDPNMLITDHLILPLHTRTFVHEYVCKYLIKKDSKPGSISACQFCRKQCFCVECLYSMERKRIKSAISKSDRKIDIHFIDIIAEFAVGTVVKCCNQINECQNELLLYRDLFDPSIYHYRPRNNSKLAYVHCLNSKMRIFCSLCSSQLRTCCSCLVMECLDNNNYCGNHLKCHICNVTALAELEQCLLCKKQYCKQSKCGDLNVAQCKSCLVKHEKNRFKEIIIDYLSNFDDFILNIIVEYAIGVTIICCNESCNEYINFASNYEYKYNFEPCMYDVRTHTFTQGTECTFRKQYHWDMYGNQSYSYPLIPIKKPIISEDEYFMDEMGDFPRILSERMMSPDVYYGNSACDLLIESPMSGSPMMDSDSEESERQNRFTQLKEKLKENDYRVHNFLGKDLIRIFCSKCSNIVVECCDDECNNQDLIACLESDEFEINVSEIKCVLHALGFESFQTFYFHN